MSLAKFVLVALVGLAPADDPRSLVGRLGAPRYAEREAAAESLRALGRDALASLREARESPDPEVRARAATLVEEIETGLMVQPTRVKLEYRDRTIAEVAKSLGDQAGLTINLIPEGPAWNARRITLVEAAPVPLWEALDAFGRVAQVHLLPGAQGMGIVGQASQPAVINAISATTPPGPSDVSGPFRVSASKLRYARERDFTPGLGGMPGMVVNNGVVIPRPPVPPAQGAGGGDDGAAGVAVETFFIDLQLMAEPRMTIAQEGLPRLTEAVDEKGRSLLPPESGNPFHHYSGYNAMPIPGGSSVQLSFPLSMPSAPGANIKRLKGSIPVVVMARKDEPLVVPLTERNKTFQNGQVTITVHEVKRDPNQPFTTLEMTVKLASRGAQQPFQQGFAAELMTFRNHPGNPQNQVEIVDSQGRPYPQWFAFNAQPGNDGTRLTLRLMQLDQNALGPPAEIRFYEMARATTEVSFELTDVPMP